MTVLARLEKLLAGVPHERIRHAPITSAAHAAELRSTPAAIGGKSILMKLKKAFTLVVVPGDGRIDGRTLRSSLGLQRYRFASTDELLEHTGLTPGSVPPFGRPIFDLPLVLDAELAARERIAFTLGTPTDSAVLAMVDYLDLAQPDHIVPLCTRTDP